MHIEHAITNGRYTFLNDDVSHTFAIVKPVVTILKTAIHGSGAGDRQSSICIQFPDQIVTAAAAGNGCRTAMAVGRC